MANRSHRILDSRTRKEYPSKAAAGRDLAHLVDGDAADQFVWFAIARAFPARFRVMNEVGRWVRLDDASAPIGTLRPEDSTERTSGTTKVTTLAIDEQKYAAVRGVLGTSTLRETVDRSFDEVLIRDARAEDVARLRKMNGIDLDKPSVMAKAWR